MVKNMLNPSVVLNQGSKPFALAFLGDNVRFERSTKLVYLVLLPLWGGYDPAILASYFVLDILHPLRECSLQGTASEGITVATSRDKQIHLADQAKRPVVIHAGKRRDVIQAICWLSAVHAERVAILVALTGNPAIKRTVGGCLPIHAIHSINNGTHRYINRVYTHVK